MRTSLSRTTGRGIPAGTSREICLADPTPVSGTVGPFACPKISPADKRIKTKADEMVRIGFTLGNCCMAVLGWPRDSSAAGSGKRELNTQDTAARIRGQSVGGGGIDTDAAGFGVGRRAK